MTRRDELQACLETVDETTRHFIQRYLATDRQDQGLRARLGRIIRLQAITRRNLRHDLSLEA